MSTDLIEITNPQWDVFTPPMIDKSTTEYEYAEYREKNVNVVDIKQYELINQDLDLFLLPSESYLQIKLNIKAAANAVITSGDIALLNSGYSIFDKAFYYMNDQLIESLDYVGLLTHVKHLCTSSKESEQTLEQQGFCLDRGYGEPSNSLTGTNGAGNVEITAFTAQAGPVLTITAAGQANNDVVVLRINGNPIVIEGIERNTGVLSIRNFVLTATPNLSISAGTVETHYRFYDGVTYKEVIFLVEGHPVKFTSPAAAGAIIPIALDGYVIVVGDRWAVEYAEDIGHRNYINGQPITNNGFERRKVNQFLSGVKKAPAVPGAGYSRQLTLMLPIWKLFPIFEANRHVFRGVKHTIRLYKAQTASDIVLRSPNTTPVDAVNINYISWWVPKLKPTIKVGLELDKQLAGGSSKVLAWNGCQMFKSNVFQASTTNGSYRITSTAHRPTKVVAFFQRTTRVSNQTINGRLFDSLYNAANTGVTQAHVRVGSKQYPEEDYTSAFTSRADSAAEDLGRLYAMYLSICGFEKDSEKGSPISYNEFRDLYPMWVFDLSAQDEAIWVNITNLDIEFRWRLGGNAAGEFIVWIFVEYQREITLTGVNSRMAIKL